MPRSKRAAAKHGPAQPRLSLSQRAAKAMRKLSRTSQKSTAKGDQSELPFADQLPAERALLKVWEAARFLSISQTHVRNLVDSGCLTGGSIGIESSAARQHLRITRESVLRFRSLRFPD